MIVKILPPELPISWARIQAGEDYIIVLNVTVYGSTQVCCQHIWDNSGYFLQWCAGPEHYDILNLVNSMLGVIEQGREDQAPAYNRVKPYFNDEIFCHFIAPFKKVWFKKITQLSPIQPVKLKKGELIINDGKGGLQLLMTGEK
jgi:hypothetical protein